jgi:repressor LexA
MARVRSTGDSLNGHVLTERRKAILAFHDDYVERYDYAPSYREIGEAVGLTSLSSVAHQMKVLAEMGFLARAARQPRTTVTKRSRHRGVHAESEPSDQTLAGIDSPDTVSVPLFEQIAAGVPVVADREAVDIMRLPRGQVGSGDLFAVKVTGDSMINASIFDGDIVVVREQNDAHNGDIVAALFEDEATVKTFRRMGGHVWLLPQNPIYDPIPGDDCRIMGKVVATIHRV